MGGERAGNRTPNLVVKSHLLCQLSYAPRRKLEAPGCEIKTESNLLFDCASMFLRCSSAGAKPTAARRLDRQLVPGLECDFDATLERVAIRVSPSQHTVLPLRARLAALETERSEYAPFGEQRDDDRSQKENPTNHAVAPM